MKIIKFILFGAILIAFESGLIFVPLINLLEKLTKNIDPEKVIIFAILGLFSLGIWATYKIIEEG